MSVPRCLRVGRRVALKRAKLAERRKTDVGTIDKPRLFVKLLITWHSCAVGSSNVARATLAAFSTARARARRGVCHLRMHAD